MNIHNNNFLKIDKDGFSEKLRKYGDPKKNLIFTSICIVLLAVLVSFFLMKKKQEGITAEYLKNFPANTNFYVDSALNNTKINGINDLTGLNIKSLPDIFNKVFEDKYNDKNRKKIVSLMNDAFDSNFCFGSWNDLKDNKNIERNLAIISIKRESKVLPLFKALTESKLVVKTLKGYNITYSADNKLAFLNTRNKLYLADSYETLEFIIKNHIVKNSTNLYKSNDVRKSIEHLDNKRIATIILPHYTYDTSKISTKFANTQLINSAANLDQLAESIGTTAISVLADKKMIKFNSVTPLDLSKIENSRVRDLFKVILNSSGANFEPKFLPEKTSGFIYINDLKNYIDLMLEMNGIKQAQEYDQAKQLVKMITSLDFDKDIMPAFSGNIIVASVDLGNSQTGNVAILENEGNNGKALPQLFKIAQSQLASAKSGKVVYKNSELDVVSSPKLPMQLCYGPISNKLYAVGDKLAVQTLIDTIDKNGTNLAVLNSFKTFNSKNINNAKFMTYLNIDFLGTIKNNPSLVDKKFIAEKLQQKVKGILFSVNSKNDLVKSSLQLTLK